MLALLVLSEHAGERLADLAERHVALDAVDHERHEVLAPARRRLEPPARRRRARRVAPPADVREQRAPALLDGRVDPEDLLRRRLVTLLEAVHADDHRLALLDGALEAVRALMDAALLETLLDRRERAAEPVDLREEAHDLALDPVREVL